MATLLEPEVLVVQDADAMDIDTFIMHMKRRHSGSVAGHAIARAQFESVEEAYRAFHERLHALNRFEHEHDA
jgi:hypothetical protein